MVVRAHVSGSWRSRAIGVAFALALVVGAGVLTPGCSKSPPAPEAATQSAPLSEGPGGPIAATTPDTSEAQAPDPGAATLVTVGDDTITVGEVRQRVEARIEQGRVMPSAALLDATIDGFIATRVLAQTARARGFELPAGAPDTSDTALAMAFAAGESQKQGEPEVTDADLQAFFGERRLAARLVMKDRARANALGNTYREAVAADPARANEIFQEMWEKAGIKDGDPQVHIATPFDLHGRGAAGQLVAHPRVAGAAFALAAVGDVSPPVSIEGDQVVLVQLREIQPARDVASLDEATREEARAAIRLRLLGERRMALVAQARDEVGVTIDQAARGALEASFANAQARSLRLPGDARARRLKDMRRIRKDGGLKLTPRDIDRVRKPGDSEIPMKMRGQRPETQP